MPHMVTSMVRTLTELVTSLIFLYSQLAQLAGIPKTFSFAGQGFPL